MGPKKSICVKLKNSAILLGCLEASKEASHWTIYESAKRTGIQTNHNSEFDSLTDSFIWIPLNTFEQKCAFSSAIKYPNEKGSSPKKAKPRRPTGKYY